MVADLFEPHQVRQHDPAALDAVDRLQLPGQLADRLLVERGLAAAQAAERVDLGFVGQVGDDAAVGLEPAQNVRPDERAQREVGVAAFARGEPFGEVGELLGPAEQAGVEEIEQRPQVGQPVLDRRAGEGDARAASKLLDGAGLPRAGVLDRLRLVENEQTPLPLAQPRQARQHRVRGDDQVSGFGDGRHLCIVLRGRAGFGRVGDERAQ